MFVIGVITETGKIGYNIVDILIYPFPLLYPTNEQLLEYDTAIFAAPPYPPEFVGVFALPTQLPPPPPLRDVPAEAPPEAPPPKPPGIPPVPPNPVYNEEPYKIGCGNPFAVVPRGRFTHAAAPAVLFVPMYKDVVVSFTRVVYALLLEFIRVPVPPPPAATIKGVGFAGGLTLNSADAPPPPAARLTLFVDVPANPGTIIKLSTEVSK